MREDSNDPIREFQNKLREIGEKAERLRPVLRSCEDAIQRAGLDKAVITVGTRNQLKPSIEITFMTRSLNETIPLFRELAKEGLKTDKSDTYTDRNLFKVIPMREYNLGPDLSVFVMLLGRPTDSDSQQICRMEQVGVKEVPIFEIKCEEEA